ncbi:hypothetical protein SAMN02744133_108165 [Thalassospira xiamenensis M-5 = DSM 17429]|uniref:Uncharacterized protein n=1 Tax=Thalassospira xiamenensis M-5 = DSM 17429 TaxID=1123366 RepID=A0AB72UJF0_9PROT|nr:hypothetical protein [Thalassospira xiamenensis]AJD54437.1 hypothetical protein TH3_21823 [Thalassospira xiamenensis M-5 = DSM 17429]SIT22186.1 hypothetical protein SAMN02744133_108165 [Thalassospira xiamenensis M-5 = DSM 17429]
MTVLVLSAICVNDFANDVPQSFVVDLHPDDIKEFQELSKEVARLQVRNIEKPFRGGHWSIDLDEDFEALSDKAAIISAARSTCQAIDVPIVRVFKDKIAFEAVPKHCSDLFTVNTPSVYLDSLQGNDTLFVSE